MEFEHKGGETYDKRHNKADYLSVFLPRKYGFLSHTAHNTILASIYTPEVVNTVDRAFSFHTRSTSAPPNSSRGRGVCHPRSQNFS